MVPAGIITIITSAIRVGGPSLLKALIGRARENLAIAEQEVMSSTSKEVCELWNGHEVVRIMGSCPVSEFICLLPDRPMDWNGDVTVMKFDEVLEKHFLERGRLFLSFPTFSTSTQVGELHLTLLLEENTWKDMYKRIRNAISLNSPKGQKEEIKIESKPKQPSASIIITRNPGIDAPNVSLNSHNHTSRAELRMVAVLGIILQLGVLIFSACAVYHPTLKVRLKKDGNPVAGYAFPLNAIGTLLLVAGMLLCAHVVESSTSEKTFRPSNNLKAQLVWLQQKTKVSDEVFDSFAIYAKNERASITTSRRWGEDRTTQEQSDKLSVGVPDQQSSSRRPASAATSSPDVTRPPRSEQTDHHDPPSLHGIVLGLKTILGTAFGLCGFIAQFVGLGALHWSASFVQFGVVIVMMLLRAWVRRGLVEPPRCQHILSEFELDWFATTFADAKNAPWWPDVQNKENKRWTIDRLEATNTGFGDSNKPLSIELPRLHAHRVMKIRRDLAQLASWHGPVSAEAIAIARSIEMTMDFFFRDTKELNYIWALNSPTRGPVVFRLHRENGKWQAYADELEAALSLWLFSVDKAENDDGLDHLNKALIGDAQDDKWLRAKGLSAENSLRILGSYSQSLHRDLLWWIPHEATRIISLTKIGNTKEQAGVLKVRNHRIVGSQESSQRSGKKTKYRIQELSEINLDPETSGNKDGAHENAKPTATSVKIDENPTLVAVEFHGPLRSLLALDIFSSFWMAAARTIEQSPFTDPAEIHPNHTTSNEGWQSFSLRSEQLTKLARAIQNTGLGSLDDIYLSMIPSLSVADKLPQVSNIIDFARHHAEPHEKRQLWHEASRVYLWLFKVAKTFPVDSEIATQAIAILVQFRRQISLELALRELVKDPRLEILRRLKSELGNELGPSNNEVEKIVASLLKLYRAQERPWNDNSIVWGCEGNEGNSKRFRQGELAYPETFKLTRAHEKILDDPSCIFSSRRENERDVNTKDVLGWTPLHYVAQTESRSRIHTYPPPLTYRFGDLTNRLAVNSQDLLGRTPLHYACGRTDPIVSFIRQLVQLGADINTQGRDGVAPIHCAAMNGNLEAAMLLAESGAHIDIQDALGKTPLLWAVISRDQATIEYLLKNANTKLRDGNGKTALHLAVIFGDDKTATWLIEHGADVQAVDRDMVAPLHHAAETGHLEIVRLLCQSGKVDVNAKIIIRKLMAPYHLAAQAGHEEVVKWLIKEAGVDVNAKGGYGHTPLHFAAKGGHEAVVKWLIEEAGADAESLGGAPGQTAIFFANKDGHKSIVQFLIDKKVYMEAKDRYRNTVLHLAARERRLGIAKLLLDAGARVSKNTGGIRRPTVRVRRGMLLRSYLHHTTP